MAAVNEHVLLDQPDKLVLLAEIPAADSQAAVTFRLLVEQCSDYGGRTMDVDTARQPDEVATETRTAAARVQARCDAHEELGLGGVEFRLRVMFIDAFGPEEEDGSGSDMEFGEFDLSGARNLQDYQQTGAGYEGDDEDEDGCGAQFSVRPYRGGRALAGEEGNLLLSGFEARSDGPELTEQHELTSHDMHRLVHLALEGGGSMEDDEAYQRAMAGGTPLSRASRAAMVDQALQSANQHHQQFRSPSQGFPMRTGF
ncbi:hypothetical protein ACQ4PT_032685 [Festuca glaucescens]